MAGALTTPAQAGGGTKFCPTGASDQPWCTMYLYPTRFPGGTMSIDVDVSGSSTQTGVWNLYIDGGKVCSGSYRFSDPPRSWTCSNVRAGVPSLDASRDYRASVTLGLRW